MPLSDLLAQLRAAISNLGSSDISFAESLISSVERRGIPTDKQRYWLEKMLAKAQRGKPESVDLGDMAGIMKLFGNAAKHLKSPAVVIQFGGIEYRLSIAGERARVPGSVNVATNDSYGASTWYGRITREGEFQPKGETPALLVDGLKRFAAEPAKVASEHGRMSGKCCFCNRALTDPRSTNVGYGKVCADRWGLPWGGSKVDLFLQQAAGTREKFDASHRAFSAQLGLLV